jgi:hypothetical protein
MNGYKRRHNQAIKGGGLFTFLLDLVLGLGLGAHDNFGFGRWFWEV